MSAGAGSAGTGAGEAAADAGGEANANFGSVADRDAAEAMVQQAIDAFVSGVGQAVLVGSVILIVTAVAVAIIAPSGMSQATVMSDLDGEGASESDPLSSLRDG